MISLGPLTLVCEPIQNNGYFKMFLKENRNIASFNYQFTEDILQKIIFDVTEHVNIYNSHIKQNAFRHDTVERKCFFMLKCKNICYEEAKSQVMTEIEKSLVLSKIPHNLEDSISKVLNALITQKNTRDDIFKEKEKWQNSEIYKSYKDMKKIQEEQILNFRNSKF